MICLEGWLTWLYCHKSGVLNIPVQYWCLTGYLRSLYLLAWWQPHQLIRICLQLTFGNFSEIVDKTHKIILLFSLNPQVVSLVVSSQYWPALLWVTSFCPLRKFHSGSAKLSSLKIIKRVCTRIPRKFQKWVPKCCTSLPSSLEQCNAWRWQLWTRKCATKCAHSL